MVDATDGQSKTIDEWISIASQLEYSNRSELIPVFYRSFELLQAIKSHTDKNNSLRELRRQLDLSMARDNQKCTDIHRLIYGFIGSLALICEKITIPTTESKSRACSLPTVDLEQQHQDLIPSLTKEPTEALSNSQQTVVVVKEEDLTDYDEFSMSSTPCSSISLNNRQPVYGASHSPFVMITPNKEEKEDTDNTKNRYPHLSALLNPQSASADTSKRRSATSPFTLGPLKQPLIPEGVFGSNSLVKSEETEIVDNQMLIDEDEKIIPNVINGDDQQRYDNVGALFNDPTVEEDVRNRSLTHSDDTREKEVKDEDDNEMMENNDDPSSSTGQNVISEASSTDKFNPDEMERTRIMTCAICKVICSSATLLLDHLRSVHNSANLRKLDQWLECDDCGRVLFYLERHTCTGSNIFLCTSDHVREKKSFEDLMKRRTMKNGFHRPDHSLKVLAAMAIKNSPSGLLPVSEIYAYICEHFPYYENTSKASWKSSIRHTLAYSKCFYKTDIVDPANKDSVTNRWGIVPEKMSKINFDGKKPKGRCSRFV